MNLSKEAKESKDSKLAFFDRLFIVAVSVGSLLPLIPYALRD